MTRVSGSTTGERGPKPRVQFCRSSELCLCNHPRANHRGANRRGSVIPLLVHLFVLSWRSWRLALHSRGRRFLTSGLDTAGISGSSIPFAALLCQQPSDFELPGLWAALPAAGNAGTGARLAQGVAPGGPLRRVCHTPLFACAFCPSGALGNLRDKILPCGKADIFPHRRGESSNSTNRYYVDSANNNGPHGNDAFCAPGVSVPFPFILMVTLRGGISTLSFSDEDTSTEKY